MAAVNVANPRVEKHGRNASSSWVTDRGRLSDRCIAAHARDAAFGKGPTRRDDLSVGGFSESEQPGLTENLYVPPM
jgi:hypothetical protein